MNTRFYFKLASTNIKKNSKAYFPYMLACIGTVMMFYIMCYITTNRGIDGIGGAAQLKSILWMGTVVIGLFSFLLLFYTNSFLIKRRKKELGLFNVLGMEKRHIARVLAVENLYVALISLSTGIISGIVLSKLMVLLLAKLLSFEYSFGIEISVLSVIITVALFGVIFMLTLLKNLRQIKLSKPVELMQGGSVGEKEPKTKWLLAGLGAVFLGTGYAIANIVKTPLDALAWFFIAVILVIAGTYCLFTAGSVAALKLMRKNKGFYYKTKHFTSVSGMIYRMKQNAVGLANICILSTMVLVMLSTTVSLYTGVDDEMRNQYPRNIEIFACNVSENDFERLKAEVNRVVSESGIETNNLLAYCYNSSYIYKNGGKFSEIQENGTPNKRATATFITLAEYNKMQGSSVTLGERAALVYCLGGYDSDVADFNGIIYDTTRIDGLNVRERTALLDGEVCFFVVSDRQAIEEIFTALGNDVSDGYLGYYGFDVNSGREEQIALAQSINKALSGFTVLDSDVNSYYDYTRCAAEAYGEFLSIYGGLFFLGLFLGTLFLMATVLIMYYKQISEGYDDKTRFEIMQKVGMSREEVRSSIRSQILKVFFLPLAAAFIHIAAAFRMIVKLLLVFNLTNVWLFAACTAATLVIFAAFYAIVYTLTARVYYRIVS